MDGLVEKDGKGGVEELQLLIQLEARAQKPLGLNIASQVIACDGLGADYVA